MHLKQYDDCIKENLLRIIPPSKQKAEESIKTAKKWLEEAEKGLENEAFNSSVMASYLAMFHAARSILFFDGYREKSHYCIARYLEENYTNKKLLEKSWIELLDYYRELRHDDQYSTSFFATKEESENALQKSRDFTDRMEKLLEDKNRVKCPKCQSLKVDVSDKNSCKDCGFSWKIISKNK